MIWRTFTGNIWASVILILVTLTPLLHGYYYRGQYYINGRSYRPDDPKVRKLRPTQKVGCDGILGSGKKLDKCGVCGGGGASCRVVSGIFIRQNLPYGYNPVTKIPKGACNINITEKAHSRNYLAVRTSSGHPVVNGNWSITNPGNYYAAGTTFKYIRPHIIGESILAKGPITEGIDLFLLYQTKYQGIYYEYTIPMVPHIQAKPPSYVPDKGRAGQSRAALQNGKTRSGSYPLSNRGSQPLYISDRQALKGGSAGGYRPSGVAASRNSGSYLPTDYRQQRYGSYNSQQRALRNHQRYTSYKSPARPPTYNNQPIRPTYNQQPRRVSDQQALSARSKGRQVNDAIPQTLPRSGRQNVRGSSANFIWKIAGFTECDRKCGGGQQLTKIICVNARTLILVTNENCDNSIKPDAQSLSCNTDPCQPDWDTTAWSKCSKTCGKGRQTRKVECKQRISSTLTLSVSADLCKDKQRPSSTHSCQQEECFSWKVDNWSACSAQCGRGQRSRKVNCIDQEGNPVADEKCNHPREKPRSKETCNEGACKKTWFYTRWAEECSADCGEGTITRKVYCQADQGRKYSESACDKAERPLSEKPCSSKKSCGGQWFAGEWSKCKGTCTDGYQTRSVVCMKKHGRWFAMVHERSCQADEKPVERQSCEQLDCDTEWYMSEWGQCSVTCGEGYRTREVKCLDKKQKLSDTCKQTTKPSIKESCSTKPCPTKAPVDPECKDSSTSCRVVVQARLCKYKYYERMCCRSCID